MQFLNAIPDSILKGREKDRPGQDIRSPYYRDTTAILHSSAFRRLKHKTQVFFAPSNDHICTRMEHVLHVASISSAICRAMKLDDELAWAIGLGHDLGHTPFGHIGEKIVSEIMEKKGMQPFQHEIHGLRVVDFLANLNLTFAVRDGIISHCGEHFVQSISPDFNVKKLNEITVRTGVLPSTWEGCVVRFSDQIAYIGRDFEDASRLGIIESKDMPKKCQKLMGSTNGEIIGKLVDDIIYTSSKKGTICFSDEVFEAIQEMKDFNYKNIYLSPMLDGYEKYFRRLINLIYEYLSELLDKFGTDEKKYMNEGNMLSAGFYNYVVEERESYLEHDGNLDRLVLDYISGMSDNFCLDCGNEILKPEHLNESIERSLTGKWFDVRR